MKSRQRADLPRVWEGRRFPPTPRDALHVQHSRSGYSLAFSSGQLRIIVSSVWQANAMPDDYETLLDYLFTLAHIYQWGPAI